MIDCGVFLRKENHADIVGLILRAGAPPFGLLLLQSFIFHTRNVPTFVQASLCMYLEYVSVDKSHERKSFYFPGLLERHALG